MDAGASARQGRGPCGSHLTASANQGARGSWHCPPRSRANTDATVGIFLYLACYTFMEPRNTRRKSVTALARFTVAARLALAAAALSGCAPMVSSVPARLEAPSAGAGLSLAHDAQLPSA